MALKRLITSVFCKTSFIGFHYWKDAPLEVEHLKSVHRHVFHVEVYVEVEHDDRHIEFQTLKRQVDLHLQNKYLDSPRAAVSMSCEMIAEELAQHLASVHGHHVTCAVVSEDGENGAELIYE